MSNEPIRYFAGRSQPRVFPFAENDSISYAETGTGTRQSQTEDNITTTISPKSNGRADGTFINVIGNLKGEGGHEAHNVYSVDGIAPTVRENYGKITNIEIKPVIIEHRRQSGEIREYKDFSPTISSKFGMGGGNVPYVTQMNDSKESGGKQPYMQNRVYDPKGISPALTEISNRLNINISEEELMLRDSRDNRSTLKSGRTTEIGIKGKSIRRLTEVECERLQGFPEIKKQFTINIWKDNYAEFQKNFVNAENKNHKKLKFVGSAEKIESEESVLSAETHLSLKDQSTNKPVQEIVLINCEEGKVEILNQGKSLLFANTVEKKKNKVPVMSTESFVLQIVRISSMLDQITHSGKEGLLQNEQLSIHQENGNSVLNLFGKEIMQPVEYATKDLTTMGKLLKDTILNLSDSEDQEQTLITLCYFVANVISGYIPKKILKNNISLQINLKYGFTQYGNYDGEVKKITKGHRYKMIGNAVTVNIAQLIAERLWKK